MRAVSSSRTRSISADRVNPTMKPDGLAEVERSLRQALQVMAHPGGGYQPEEWSLLATRIAEAGLLIREQEESASDALRSLLEETVEELRDLTDGFTDQSFLRNTRAARRRNPTLFMARA